MVAFFFVVMKSVLSCGNGVDEFVICRPPRHLCGDGTSCGCVAHGLLHGGTFVVRRAIAAFGHNLSPLGLLCLLRWVRPLEDMERLWRRGFRLGCFLLLRTVMSGGGGFAFAECTVFRSSWLGGRLRMG